LRPRRLKPEIEVIDIRMRVREMEVEETETRSLEPREQIETKEPRPEGRKEQSR
jgi:hypothetical protein